MSSSNPDTPTSPSQWSEKELRQRLTMLEQVIQERSSTIETLQRELRVASSKVRIVDEVQSENKLLRARLTEMMMKMNNNNKSNNNKSNDTTTGSDDASSSSSTKSEGGGGSSSNKSSTKKEETMLERLRRQLNDTGAPSPITSYDHNDDEFDGSNLPPTEEDQINEVMNEAMDSIEVESKEERLLRERLEKLTKGK